MYEGPRVDGAYTVFRTKMSIWIKFWLLEVSEKLCPHIFIVLWLPAKNPSASFHSWGAGKSLTNMTNGLIYLSRKLRKHKISSGLRKWHEPNIIGFDHNNTFIILMFVVGSKHSPNMYSSLPIKSWKWTNGVIYLLRKLRKLKISSGLRKWHKIIFH